MFSLVIQEPKSRGGGFREEFHKDGNGLTCPSTTQPDHLPIWMLGLVCSIKLLLMRSSLYHIFWTLGDLRNKFCMGRGLYPHLYSLISVLPKLLWSKPFYSGILPVTFLSWVPSSSFTNDVPWTQPDLRPWLPLLSDCKFPHPISTHSLRETWPCF